MRIMFVSAAFPPEYTGISAYTANMACCLSSAGHDVVIATTRKKELPEKSTDVHGTILRCYEPDEMYSPQLARRLLGIAEQFSVDLIECADHLGEAGAMLRETRSIPICIKAHNSGPVVVGRESEILYRWQRWMQWAAIFRNLRQYRNEKYSLEHGDFLTVPSKRLLVEMENQGLRLPTCREVLPNPILLSQSPPKPKESPHPELLFVGRLAIGKGIGVLPELLKNLAPRFPNLKLVIAGPDSYARGLGSLKDWLKKRFGRLLTQVEFTGPLDRQELFERYDRSWLVLVPSLWDTFPTVVLEAMSRQKPVVASTNGGMEEMLEGTLCTCSPPDSAEYLEAIVKLLEERRFRTAAGASMWHKAKAAYDGPVIAQQYIDCAHNFLHSFRP